MENPTAPSLATIAAKMKDACHNCRTTENVLWRGLTNNLQCSNCYIYYKKHQEPRPLLFEEYRKVNQKTKNGATATDADKAKKIDLGIKLRDERKERKKRAQERSTADAGASSSGGSD